MIQHYRSLPDVPGLNRLRKIADTYKVEFTAFGGAVRNLCLALVRRGTSIDRVSLDEIAPFLSDIDLLHSGPPSLTPLLTRKLLSRIPFAEFYRWQIRSRDDHAPFLDALQYGSIIPVNLMTLSSSSTAGVRDDWGGIRDLESRKLRFIRNGFYRKSPLFRAGRDLELFGVLMYYRVLFQAGIEGNEFSAQPGLDDARRVIADTVASTDARIALEEHAYLRMRLRYLLSALYAEAGLAAIEAQWETLALDRVERYLSPDPRMWLPRRRDGVLTCSSYLGGDTFRLPFDTPLWLHGDDAAREAAAILAAVKRKDGKTAQLGDGQDVFLASPQLPVTAGRSKSSEFGNRFSHEFLHFSIPVPEHIDLPHREELAAIGAVRAESETLLFSPPSVVKVAWEAPGLQARINCAGLLQDWDAIRSHLALKADPKVQFLIVRWTR